MTLFPKSANVDGLQADLDRLLTSLPNLKHGELIAQALATIVQIGENETERLDWKLIVGSLRDMQSAVEVFHPYRHIRKVSVFGSARMSPDEPEYVQAQNFARCITGMDFMVMTGAGGGIMAAGNEGAGKDFSFGLNINLPFEQTSNSEIQNSQRLVNFKYFFTRKLFFLRESDAIALFPGGFGTQDELFECLTLSQTGKVVPLPLILIDKPGGDYWLQWNAYIQKHLLDRGLISEEDRNLYFITDNIEAACKRIANFYSVYHSCRWVEDKFVIRLNCDISEAHLERLNQNFADILLEGTINRSNAFSQEKNEIDTLALPRLWMYFNQRSYGRLQELILAINDIRDEGDLLVCHPAQK